MQAAVATELLISGLALLTVPTILIVIMPIIDAILTENVVAILNGVMDAVEYLIGSKNISLLLALFGIIMFVVFIRRIKSFFTEASK